jgi:hypothetical protein
MTDKKKPYIKPRLSKVRLVAKEAVLGTCKYRNGNSGLCAPDPNCLGAQARS